MNKDKGINFLLHRTSTLCCVGIICIGGGSCSFSWQLFNSLTTSLQLKSFESSMSLF
jgi:hypothetical protein